MGNDLVPLNNSVVGPTRFYHFRQNNSGGSFDIDIDRGISVSVIVEATSSDHANDRAEEIGLYFDGCRAGRDCDCCGDRWYAQWGTAEGDPVPSKYGSPLGPSMFRSWAGDQPDTIVHFLDGRGAYFDEDGNQVEKDGTIIGVVVD